MKYKTTKTISLIMVIILLLGAFAGCSNALNGDKETTPSVNAGAKPVGIDCASIEISEEKENEIIELYAKTYEFEKEKIAVDIISDFNGTYAVVCNSGQGIIGSKEFSTYFPGLTKMWSLEYYENINGWDFVYAESEPIHIIYNGVCYRLRQAYEQGIINEAELYVIYTRNKVDKGYTIEDSQYFVDFEVAVYIRPSYYDKIYTIEDFASVGCTDIEDVKYADKARCLFLTLSEKTNENVLRAVEILKPNPEFYKVNPHYNSFRPLNTTPNDPFISYNDEWAIDKISLPAAWDITTGSSDVKVGILDSGVYADHPDLVNRVDGKMSSEASSTWNLCYSDHGTCVASIIGAEGDNGLYISGVCWDVTLISFNIHDSATDFNESKILSALTYAKNNGIKILNMSFGGYAEYSSVRYLENAISIYGGLVICAAGNHNNNNDSRPLYPASFDLDNIISVGASTESDRMWTVDTDDGSNYGKNSVDIFAPGEAVYFCYPSSFCNDGTHDVENTVHKSVGLHTSQGSSYAAAYVTGVAALMLSIHPDLTPTQIKQIIIDSVDVVYDVYGNSVFEDFCVSGGRLNAYKALKSDSLHSFDLVSNGESTHSNVCSDCGYVSSTEAHTLICKYPGSRHTVLCQKCRYSQPNLITYVNDSVASGHTFTCSICDRSGIEAHDWKAILGTYTCLKCHATTSYIPEIMSLPPEIIALIEAKGLTGDFALMIDEETALCCVDGEYYYVIADNEAEALELLTSELAVVKPDVQTE